MATLLIMATVLLMSENVPGPNVLGLAGHLTVRPNGTKRDQEIHSLARLEAEPTKLQDSRFEIRDSRFEVHRSNI